MTALRRFIGPAAAAVSALAVLAACGTTSESTETALAEQQVEAPPAHDLTPAAPTRIASTGVHPGAAVYAQACAMCHDNAEATRSPTKEALGQMSFQYLTYSLTRGKMQVQAAHLNETQRGDLISYLTGRDTSTVDTWTQAMMCTGARAQVNLSAQPSVVGFGFDRNNTRAVTAAQAGFGAKQLTGVELAWSLGFPDATTMRSQGAVIGENLFLPIADTGSMYAFDLSEKDKPCVQWVYTAPGGAPLRTSPAYGVIADGTPLLVFSGLDSTVHAVDARTGKAVWTKNVGYYSYSMTTGTPTILKDRVIVPVSQYEIMAAADNAVECCTNQGFILSLDPKTGDEQWRYNTLPDAKPIRDRGDGKMLIGPAGAPIWNSPAVDETRGLIYFGTGESNSPPAHENTNAIIAIGLADGKQRWSFHATPKDIYNAGCGPRPRADQFNCVGPDETVYRDVDFGASMILGKASDGRELVYAGQKSGSVWAMNPDTGEVVWRTALGTGGALGGVHWGIAFANDLVYAPIANVGRPIPGEWDGDPPLKPGLHALDAKTGAIKWSFSADIPESVTNPRARAQAAAFSTAPTVIGDVVIAAALDGTVYALNAKSGAFLWSYATAKEFDTFNGVPGKGGAIDAASIYAANGLLFVNSGYGMFGQMPGNVLLAFKPKD